MVSRREFIAAASAAAVIASRAGLSVRALAAGAKLTQDELLKFDSVGNVTLVHLTDLHAQVMPIYFREPSFNIGVGAAKGIPPHIVDAEFRKQFGIDANSALAYALTSDDFKELAKSYGAMGGLDRVATVVNAIRAERGDRMLFLDGGDTWTNSWVSLKTQGQDVIDAMSLLKPDAMTAHWEFTLGEQRVREIIDKLGFPFLAQNVRDTEFEEKVFEASHVFERNGVRIGVVGQAFPFTPIANPRWMFPNWSFGIREREIAAEVEALRSGGADLIVMLSHNGFDVDRKLAEKVPGIDVILAGHTHDAIPQLTKVGQTLIVASGSNGKFVSRLDLDVQDKKIANFSYRLIPIFSDVIAPDPAVRTAIEKSRAPYKAELERNLGHANSLLYRRGTFDGTLDAMICDAILAQRDVEIALSPGFRWGPSILPESAITFEDITNATAMTYPACYRMKMSGERLKAVLEDVADNIFNPDPYYQQGGDMVRCGGIGYTIDVSEGMGRRISNLTHLKTGKPIEAAKDYLVGGWASINQDTEGPAIWDVVANYISDKKTVDISSPSNVRVKE
ncbi:5'-Nucleotidase domain protein [Hyphomicrobium denitrificans ATCC 51888]|uniref:5'-Nucleotidase domain protein n=1 Tax=Hyphomicrobium denitrificans (strain ATCC 51888 / DSM 1869 / NCIMB 11706 / TK 0415) TaxID=582899 RepID=D8JTG4_HYPDA|nr:thiosulfohydrolase SoxB [Hyphomicrobium denitrificans]ADJ22526.1 5'-Nucleotidase domain protein [Hyphomicrobium denitrificans ATCC 51888]